MAIKSVFKFTSKSPSGSKQTIKCSRSNPGYLVPFVTNHMKDISMPADFRGVVV